MSRWERDALRAELDAELERERSSLTQPKPKRKQRLMADSSSSSSSDEEERKYNRKPPPQLPRSDSSSSDSTSLVIKEQLAPQPEAKRRVQSTRIPSPRQRERQRSRTPSPTPPPRQQRRVEVDHSPFNPHRDSTLSPGHHDRLVSPRERPHVRSDSPSLSFIDRELDEANRTGHFTRLTVQPVSARDRRGPRPPDSPSLSDLLRPDRHDPLGDPLGKHHFQGIATVAVPVRSEPGLNRLERGLHWRNEMPLTAAEMRRRAELEDGGLLANPLGESVDLLLSPNAFDGALGRDTAPGVALLQEHDEREALLDERDLREGRPKNHGRFVHSDEQYRHREEQAHRFSRSHVGIDGASYVPAQSASSALFQPLAAVRQHQQQRDRDADELADFARNLITPREGEQLRAPPSPGSPRAGHIDLRLEPPASPRELDDIRRNGGMARKHVGQTGQERPTRDLFDLTPRVDASNLMRMGATQVPKLNLTGLGAVTQGQQEEKQQVVSLLNKPTASDLLIEPKSHVHTLSGNQVPVIDFSRASQSAISISHGRDCVICHDHLAMIWCEECTMSLCAVCDQTLHQHLEFHERVSLNDLPELQAKKKQNLAQMKARVEERKNQSHYQKGFTKDLTLLEPPDHLELPPRTPPSPVHLFQLETYVAEGAKLEKDAEIDFFTLAGICAVCQVNQAKLWCEDCSIPLCTHDDTLPKILNRKSCAEELHEKELQFHRLVPFDPAVHKRKMKRSTDELLLLPSEETKHGHYGGTGIWANATPPPSLPPSELPSPVNHRALGVGANKKKMTLTEKGYNYVTGSTSTLPPCEICCENPSVLFCHDCRFFLCISGGCDTDLHRQVKHDSNHDFIEHDRRYLKDGEKVRLTPLDQGTALKSFGTSFVAPSQKRVKRDRSRSRSRSPSRRAGSHKSPASNSSRFHKHVYSKSQWCEICRRFGAQIMCLDCELNFCEGGTKEERLKAGVGEKDVKNCNATWHAQEPAFAKHSRKLIDLSLIDTARQRRPSPSRIMDGPVSSRSSLTGTARSGSISQRILSSRSATGSGGGTSRRSIHTGLTSESSGEDEIRRTKRELAELRERREEEEAMLAIERSKIEAEERRLKEEARLEEERMRVEEERLRLQQEEDELDDIQLMQREQRRRARELSEQEDAQARTRRLNAGLGTISQPVTARSLPHDHPDFDPLSVHPIPNCSSCETNRADVWCKDCKAFFCAHPLNEWDLKTPRDGRKEMGSSSSTTGGRPGLGRVPSPPHTSRHHNNCDFHRHNLPHSREHVRLALPHYAALKVERREKRLQERQQELDAQAKAAERARQREAELQARMEEQRQERLREKEEAKARRKQEREIRRLAREQQLRQQEQAAQEDADRRASALRAQSEQEHLQFLKDQRKRISEMEKRRSAMLAELRQEEEREHQRHLKLLAKRDEELQAEELERWRISRDEARRKRTVRLGNLKKLREWNARRRIEEERWADQVQNELAERTRAELERRKALKKAEEARLDRLVERSRIITHQTPIDFSIPAVTAEEPSQFQKNLRKEQSDNRREILDQEQVRRADEKERQQEAILEGSMKAREIVREQREKEEDARAFEERKQQREFLEQQKERKLERLAAKAREKAKLEKEEAKRLRKQQLLDEEKARHLLERAKLSVLREERLERERQERLSERRRQRREDGLSSRSGTITNRSDSSRATGSSAPTHHTIPSLKSLISNELVAASSKRSSNSHSTGTGKSSHVTTPDDSRRGRQTVDSRDRSRSRSISRSRSRSRSRSSSRSPRRSHHKKRHRKHRTLDRSRSRDRHRSHSSDRSRSRSPRPRHSSSRDRR